VLQLIGGENGNMTNAPPPDDDDDFELELEEVDPEILAMERRRAEKKTEAAVASINPDELYPDEHSEGLGIDWEGLKQFRFTTRHLLIFTAGLALVMTLFVVTNPCSGVFILGVVALSAGWWWVMRQERRHELERVRRREEFFASQGPGGEAAASDAAPRRREFAFRFSMLELLGAMTAAAVVLGLSALMGPENLAMILGIVALVGVAVLMLVDVPPVVVLAWWILLVLYLAVGALAAVWSRDGDQASRTSNSLSRSSTPRSCSHWAAHQQNSAQAVPTLHPASTSVGQWTPRYTRLAPTAAVSTTATVRQSALSRLRGTNREATRPSVRYTVADIVECPLGKLEV